MYLLNILVFLIVNRRFVDGYIKCFKRLIDTKFYLDNWKVGHSRFQEKLKLERYKITK